MRLRMMWVTMMFGAALMAAPGYKLLSKISLPGDGGWDYVTVDSAAARMYVSHGTQVEVVDLATGKALASIKGLSGVHGIALVQKANRGFITSGQTNDVAVFDLQTNEVTARIPVGKKPDAIIYDPSTDLVIVNNNGGGNSTLISGKDAKVVGTVELGGAPEFAAADGKGLVFINLEDTHETVKVDLKARKVLARYKLTPNETPTGLAMDVERRRLFVGCRSKAAVVLDADTGKIVFSAPIGERVDAAAFDPATGLAYFSNGDGTVNIFEQSKAGSYTAVETVKTEAGAKTMALDKKTHRIYLPAAEREGNKVKPGTFHVLVYGN